jgi:hypothetical protein
MESNEIIEEPKYIKQLEKSKEIIQKIIDEYKNLPSYIEEEIIKPFNDFEAKIKNNIKDDKTNKSQESNNNEFKHMIIEYIKI